MGPTKPKPVGQLPQGCGTSTGQGHGRQALHARGLEIPSVQYEGIPTRRPPATAEGVPLPEAEGAPLPRLKELHHQEVVSLLLQLLNQLLQQKKAVPRESSGLTMVGDAAPGSAGAAATGSDRDVDPGGDVEDATGTTPPDAHHDGRHGGWDYDWHRWQQVWDRRYGRRRGHG